MRAMVRRITGTEIFRQIIETADNAADAVEDAAFLAGASIDAGSDVRLPAPLIALAQLVLDGATSFQRTLETAPLVHRGGGREPVKDFLEAADHVVSIEHQTDQRERDVTVALLAAPIDGRQMYLIDAITRHLEEAADALMRASMMLRDHILGEVMFE